MRRTEDDHRPIRLVWLPAIAAGALCAIVAWPQTRTIALRQMQMLAPTDRAIAHGSPFGYTDEAIGQHVAPTVQQTATAHSDDIGEQIAAATNTKYYADDTQREPEPLTQSDARLARLGKLVARFPDQPSVYATALRYKMSGKVRCTREEASSFNINVRPQDRPVRLEHSLPADVELFDREAAEAERLDPTNAYFPMIRATALFEAHEDTGAINEIQKAAACTRWDEYLAAEMDGQVRLQTDAFGEGGPLVRTTFGAGILLPHLSSIRSAAKVAVTDAAALEAAGQIREGLAIRTAVRRVGSLMRSESGNLIGSIVGSSLVQVSLVKTPGAKSAPTVDVFTNAPARAELMRQFDAFLTSAGSLGEAESVHREVDACVRARSIVLTGIKQCVYETDQITVLGLTLADETILSAVLWFATLGGIVCLLMAISRTKLLRSLSRGVAAGLMSLIAVAVAASVLPILIHQAQGSVGTVARLVGLWFSGDSSLPDHRLLHAFSDGYLGVIAAGPALLVLSITTLCFVWRAPVTAGVARGVRGCIVPICSVLMLAYVVLVPVTAAYEARLNAGLNETFQNEGRYIANRLSAEWPGRVW